MHDVPPSIAGAGVGAGLVDVVVGVEESVEVPVVSDAAPGVSDAAPGVVLWVVVVVALPGSELVSGGVVVVRVVVGLVVASLVSVQVLAGVVVIVDVVV